MGPPLHHYYNGRCLLMFPDPWPFLGHRASQRGHLSIYPGQSPQHRLGPNPCHEEFHAEPASGRYRVVFSIAGSARGAGDDGRPCGGATQHGLGWRLPARLYHRAWRRNHPRRSAGALSAAVGAAPVLSRADGRGGLRDHSARTRGVSAEPCVPRARCDRAWYSPWPAATSRGNSTSPYRS